MAACAQHHDPLRPEHTRYLPGPAAPDKCQMGTHRGKALDAHTNSSTAHSETLGIKALFKGQLSFKFENQKNVKGAKEVIFTLFVKGSVPP